MSRLRWVFDGKWTTSTGERFAIKLCACDTGRYILYDRNHGEIDHPLHYPTVEAAKAAAEARWEAEASA